MGWMKDFNKERIGSKKNGAVSKAGTGLLVIAIGMVEVIVFSGNWLLRSNALALTISAMFECKKSKCDRPIFVPLCETVAKFKGYNLLGKENMRLFVN
jgi:hypothetical protein